MKKVIRFVLENNTEQELVIQIFERLEEFMGDDDRYLFLCKKDYNQIKEEFGVKC